MVLAASSTHSAQEVPLQVGYNNTKALLLQLLHTQWGPGFVAFTPCNITRLKNNNRKKKDDESKNDNKVGVESS